MKSKLFFILFLCAGSNLARALDWLSNELLQSKALINRGRHLARLISQDNIRETYVFAFRSLIYYEKAPSDFLEFVVTIYMKYTHALGAYISPEYSPTYPNHIEFWRKITLAAIGFIGIKEYHDNTRIDDCAKFALFVCAALIFEKFVFAPLRDTLHPNPLDQYSVDAHYIMSMLYYIFYGVQLFGCVSQNLTKASVSKMIIMFPIGDRFCIEIINDYLFRWISFPELSLEEKLPLNVFCMNVILLFIGMLRSHRYLYIQDFLEFVKIVCCFVPIHLAMNYVINYLLQIGYDKCMNYKVFVV